MPRMRLSLRWKIFSGCILLTVLILLVNFFQTRALLEKTAASGTEMQTLIKHYLEFQQSVANRITTAVDIWATSKRMGETVRAAPNDADRELNSMLNDVESSVRKFKPAFIIVVSKDMLLYRGTLPLHAEELKATRLFADLRNGVEVSNAVIANKDHAYLVSGAPIQRPGEPSSGVMLMGMSYELLFNDFKVSRQDDREDRTANLELALLDNHNETIESTFRRSLWDDMARARGTMRTVVEGDGSSKVITVGSPADGGKVDFDFAQNAVNDEQQGTIYVLRNRLAKELRRKELLKDTLWLLVISLGIAAFVSLTMSVLLTRPIRKFIDATRALAHGEGDLTKRLEVGSTSEMAELAENLNAMFSNLHTLANEVQGASFQVGASSAEISAASKQMLSGASDQAAKIESSTAAVTELSSSIQQVAENAVQATKVARESGDSLQNGIARLGATSSLIEETSEKIQQLGQSGKRIGNIVEVIRQISEQTSLLALNASIEAAHAGEQGRGFAVVADEVSSLARRVGQSAKDIEGLIAAITEQTAEAVHSMQNVTRAFTEHTSGTAEMQAALRQIVEVIQDTARSVQEQAVVSDEIARNMDAVQKIAHEVLSSSEEAVVQGEGLHELALRLEQLVRGFRVEREGHGNGDARALPRGTSPALPEKSSERRRVARG